MSKALITFVKAPIKGTVKTRLQKDLPKEQVLEIYKKSYGNEYPKTKSITKLLEQWKTKKKNKKFIFF